MRELYIELVYVVFILFFVLNLKYIIIPKMKKEMKDFKWNMYFKQCGIYQGKSHWTTLKSYLIKLSGL